VREVNSNYQSILGSAIAAALCASLAAGAALADPPSKPPEAPPATASPAPETSGPAPLADSLTGSAKEAYDAGKQLYRAGDFTGALLQFERAYDLSSDARLLWNVAICEKNLHHYARARKVLERYQIEAGPQLTEQNRKDAKDLSAALSKFISTLRISVSERGASVFIDGDLVGKSPLPEPLLVDMGSRRIRVVKKGFVDFEERRVLLGETDTELDIKLTADVREGRLVIKAGKDDVIRLDGRVVGQGQWDGNLRSGGHTLRVTAPGMKPYQSEVIVQDDSVRRIQITLDPEGRGGLPTWLLITGGAVLATGLGVSAGYAIFKAGEAPPPAAGNLPPYSIDVR
jgi:hypothetical protein